MFSKVRKSLLFSAFLFNSFLLFANSYKISKVNLHVSGITQPYILEQKVGFQKGTVLRDEEAFEKYLKDLNQRFENTRNFSSVDIQYSMTDPDENGLCLVTLDVKTTDSSHFLPLPYGTFSSSSGFAAKLKMKDTNFLGTMNELSASLDFQFKPDSNGNQFKQFEPRFTFTYNYPFKKDKWNFSWNNDYDISYLWGKKSPEWALKTGLTAKYPYKKTTLTWNFTQSFIHEYDYERNDKGSGWGDATFFREYLSFQTPFKICSIPNLSNLTFTPSISATYNWDPFDYNGISGINYYSLQSPYFTLSGNFSAGKTNWSGNFRNGFSFSFGPSATYNIGSYWDEKTTRYKLGITARANAFKAFDTIGFNARFWGFANVFGDEKFPLINGTSRVDSYLRGVVNDRRSQYNKGYYQGDTPAALVFNFDMPVHLFSTHWEDYQIAKKLKFMRKLNFEVQASPFMDFALIQTTMQRQGYKRTFDLRDGFYCAGLEVLVYPKNWKSYVIRASAGVDIGRKLFGPLLSNEWRDQKISSIEISIGLGLHY